MGDVYFDFGWTGVLIAGLLMGVLVVRIHVWALRSATLASAWVASTVVVMFLSGIVAFRFLWLEAWVWPLAGGFLFALAQRPKVASQ